MTKRIKPTIDAEHELTPYEYNYLRGLALARNRAYNEYQAIISTFLAYLAGASWGYKDVELDFAFDEEKQTVRVTEHVDQTANTGLAQSDMVDGEHSE
jgi:hypothetical protein